MIYHYPMLSNYDFLLFRMKGSGLANNLFPMYRAFQKSKETNGVFIFPPIVQLKIGPFIRGESDKRVYLNLFKRRSFDELMKLKVLFSSKKYDELSSNLLNKDKDGVIIYKGIEDLSGSNKYYFFKSFNQEYKEEFISMLIARSKKRDRLFSELKLITKDDICFHIRRGDFPVKGLKDDPFRQISDEWFIKVLDYLAREFPRKKIRIFTDDTTSLSNELLSIKDVSVDSSYNAWHAILKMSAHGTIVASTSTFSLWSAFIGDQKIITNNESNLSRFINNEIQVI
jgi:hypothetical protein